MFSLAVFPVVSTGRSKRWDSLKMRTFALKIMALLLRILPEPLTGVIKRPLLKKLRSKILAGGAMLVTAVRAIEEEYGERGVEIIHEAFMKRAIEIGKEKARGTNDHSLRGFCSALEEGCNLTHEWTKIEDTDVRRAYCFTRCIWADVFRELDAHDIGFWICEGDGPAVAAFNPAIGFDRTKTLMMGDDCCDHIYVLKDKVDANRQRR